MSSASIPTDHWLEQLYWMSQVGLLIVALVAAYAAYRQISTLKLFEVLKYLQDENFRVSRRTVITKIGALQGTEWWNDPDLEACASSCCGHYDIVGNILKFGGGERLTSFFAEHWAESIVRTYSVLQPFIQRRRAAEGNYYLGYEWLYLLARKHRPLVGAPWPPLTQSIKTSDPNIKTTEEESCAKQ